MKTEPIRTTIIAEDVESNICQHDVRGGECIKCNLVIESDDDFYDESEGCDD